MNNFYSGNYRKKNEVFEACHNLHSRGDNITNESIMQELVRLGYKKGSNSDVTRYKKLWHEQRLELEETTIALPERPDKLTQVIDEIRIEAQREARLELDQFKADNDAKIKELQETLHYAHQEIADLRNKNATLEQQCQELQKTTLQFTDEIDTLKEQIVNQARGHREAQTVVSQENKHLLTEKESLKIQLEKLLETHQHLQEIAKAERSDLMERIENQRHQYLATQIKLEDSIHGLEKKIEKLIVENQLLKKQLDSANLWSYFVKELRKQADTYQQQQTSQTQNLFQSRQALTKSFEQLQNSLQIEIAQIVDQFQLNTNLLMSICDRLEHPIVISADKDKS